MDFSLNEEQIMIRDSCRHFVAQHYSLDEWTKLAKAGGFSRENWKALADLGYLSINQPEQYGGMGGAVELAVVCQEFGRGLLLEPYVGTAVLAARLIAAAGSEHQKQSLLPAIIGGDSIVSLAHGELGKQVTDRLDAKLLREGEAYRLSGRKTLVLAAGVADLLIVSAMLDDELTFVLVDPNTAGVSIESAPLLDRTWASDITFDAVKLVPDRVLAGGTGARAALSDALRHANLAVCAEMVGIVDRALEVAVEDMKSRSQFGAPLSTFQALRHRVADLAIDREMARATLSVLLASFQDPGTHEPDITVAMAKAQLGEIGRRVCAQAIQLHGAMGMTSECGVGRYFARANTINALFGRTDVQFETYTQLLAKQIKAEA